MGQNKQKGKIKLPALDEVQNNTSNQHLSLLWLLSSFNSCLHLKMVKVQWEFHIFLAAEYS